MKKGVIYIVLITICAVLFYGIRYVKKPVNTEAAYLTKYESSISGEAYIVKNEYVNKATATGTMYQYFSEGNRVGKNRKIASIYSGNINTDVLQELNNLEKKIEFLKAQANTKMTSDNSSSENKILTYKQDIIDSVYNQDISNIYKYKDNIKNIRGGNDNLDDNSEVDELIKKKEQLESKIGTKKNDIYSNIAGVFIPIVDGYEDILTPEKIKGYSVDDFNALEKPVSTQYKESVTTGDNICKIVNNNEWYAVIKVKQLNILDNYSVGSKVKIRFDTILGVETDAVITDISPAINGEVVVTVKSEKYMDGIYSLRYSKAEILLKSYVGYKVPIYAIKVKDNKKGILVEVGNSSIFKPCEILYTNEEECFVIIKSEENSPNPIETADRILLGEK